MWGNAWYLVQETFLSVERNRGLVYNSAKQAIFGLADDYVPRNGDDLYKSYAPFVTRLVTRYNRVSANFDDLLQHVWVEILRVDLITKYNSSTGSIPENVDHGSDSLLFGYDVGRFQVHDDQNG